MRPSPAYAIVPCASGLRHALAFHEGGPPEPAKPRLLDRVRAAARLRHYSRRTEAAYVAWIRRYIFFHGKRRPAELGAAEVMGFLSSLAADGRVAASTQNQALGALLFLYRDVLALDLPWLDGVVRAKRPERLPVVLTREEVAAVLRSLTGVPRLMASLLCGSGLRLLECYRLRRAQRLYNAAASEYRARGEEVILTVSQHGVEDVRPSPGFGVSSFIVPGPPRRITPSEWIARALDRKGRADRYGPAERARTTLVIDCSREVLIGREDAADVRADLEGDTLGFAEAWAVSVNWSSPSRGLLLAP